MATLVEWYTHKFEVASDSIRVFNDLSVSGTCETEEKESSKEKYVSLKNRKPAEITLTAILNAYLGCDVQNEVMTFVNEAQKGTSDFLYANGGKLMGCKLMLTSAKATKIDIAPGGKWTHAQVALTFKQSTKADGTVASSSGGGGSSGGGSSSKSSGGGSSSSKTQYGTPYQSLIGTSSVFAPAAEEKAKQGAIEYANSQAAKDAAKAQLVSNAYKPSNPANTLSALTKAAVSSKTSSSSSSSSKTSSTSSAAAKVSSVVSKTTSSSTKVTVKKN